MSKTTLRAGTAPFAHLLSRFTGSRRAEDEKPEDQESEEARKARRAEEDKQREEEDARRAEEDERRREEDARRAEEDGESESDEDEDEEGRDDKDGKKGKRAKKAKKADEDEQDPEADDGDDDEECEEDGQDEKEAKAFRRGLAEGRARENTRAARIFKHPGAAARPDLAATLAFTTRNSSAEAGRLMAAATVETGRPRGRSLDDRMGGRSDARPGGAGGGGQPSLAERIVAAGKKRRGEI